MKQNNGSVKNAFSLKGKVAIITGGAGLLGGKHAEAIAEMSGVPILLDIDEKKAISSAKKIKKEFNVDSIGLSCDITSEDSIKKALSKILKLHKKVDILINNAASNPKVEGPKSKSSLENFPLDTWNKDLSVGLTGSFLCSKIIGSQMSRQGKGVILNIASDLALIGPDHEYDSRFIFILISHPGQRY